MRRTSSCRKAARNSGLNDRPQTCSCLDDAACARTAIQTFRHHFRQDQREIGRFAVAARISLDLVDQRKNQVLHEQRHPVSRLQGARHQSLRKILRAWDAPGQLEAIIYPERLEMNHFVGDWKRRSPRKRTGRQQDEKRNVGKRADELDEQLR